MTKFGAIEQAARVVGETVADAARAVSRDGAAGVAGGLRAEVDSIWTGAEMMAGRGAGRGAAPAQRGSSNLLRETVQNTRSDGSVGFSGTDQPAASSDPFRMFDAAHYRFVPVRQLVSDIKSANDFSISHANIDGAKVYANPDNRITHVVFSNSMSAEQKADTLLAASFAQMIHTDPAALEAASKYERDAIGFMPSKVDAFATPQEAADIAFSGGRSYVAGEQGNRYTDFLRGRLGPFSDEHRMWGRDILTSPHGPSSAWNSTLVPADDAAIRSIIESAQPIPSAPRYVRNRRADKAD